jgi:predicted ArsR family transcriptional regulator
MTRREPTVQRQARALGDPTRHALFRAIDAAGAPIGVAELNEQFPLNHNAIRQHLAKLVDAGLVVESTAPSSGRGRPRLVYQVDPAVEGQWGTNGPYERLSLLLLELLHTDHDPATVGRDAASTFQVPSPSGDVVADIATAMARHGFDPEIRPSPGGAEIVLHACPFSRAALADRETICALHLGIAEGLAHDTEAHVVELVAHDPRQPACRLRLAVGTERPAEPDASPAPEPDAATLSLRGTVGRR